MLDVTEYPTFDAEDGHGILNIDDDVDEEFEIDINDVRACTASCHMEAQSNCQIPRSDITVSELIPR